MTYTKDFDELSTQYQIYLLLVLWSLLAKLLIYYCGQSRMILGKVVIYG